MFRLDSSNVYRAEGLGRLEWLDHGFGTRLSAWPSGPLATLQQIHSDICRRADGEGRLGEGDCLIGDRAGLMLGVRTADCIPVLLADPGRKAVAAIHAGWKGTSAGIVAKAVAAMAREFGSRAEELLAAVGPGIGGCCYEVGPEVAGRFTAIFPERSDLGEKTRIDLAEANRRLLEGAGVMAERIEVAGLCTRCGSQFHSFRRDGGRERMISAIGVIG